MQTLDKQQSPKMKITEAVLLIFGILFISFNLRAPITAVGTIVNMIQSEYNLSDAVAGIITTIPLITFAVVSPFVAKICHKLGNSITMMLGLIFILIGEVVRSCPSAAGLFIGTAVIGIGIAIGNVVIPAIIKSQFPGKVGLVTSIYTSGMCIFAAVGAGISLPLAECLGDWKYSLVAWFVLTIPTIAIWIPQIIKKKKSPAPATETASVTETSETAVVTQSNESTETTAPAKQARVKKSSIWKSPLAWWVTLFMGIQSLLFYSLVAWLPKIIISKALPEDFASTMAMTFQLVAIPATLLVPILAGKLKSQRMLAVGTCIVYACGMICFLAGQNAAMMILAVILMSLGMGGCISLSIAFISMRSPNPVRASELSGMSQSAGYLLAAVGPFLTGLLHDLLQSWTVPLILFIILIAILAFCGLFAGANKTVSED